MLKRYCSALSKVFLINQVLNDTILNFVFDNIIASKPNYM